MFGSPERTQAKHLFLAHQGNCQACSSPGVHHWSRWCQDRLRELWSGNEECGAAMCCAYIDNYVLSGDYALELEKNSTSPQLSMPLRLAKAPGQKASALLLTFKSYVRFSAGECRKLVFISPDSAEQEGSLGGGW